MTPTPAHIEQARQMWEVATPQERVWLVQMWEEERAAQFTALVDTIAEDGEGAFGAFIRWAWPIVEPGGALVWEWPQELMASYLHRLMRFEITRLVICVPPGSAKSLLCSVMFPAYDWLHRPWIRALYTSTSAKVSQQDATRCRDIVSHPDYVRLAAAVAERLGGKAWTLKKGDQEKLAYKTTQQGQRMTHVMGGDLIGLRGHRQVVDDPMDVREVIEGTPERIAERCREANDVIFKKLSTRLNEGPGLTPTRLLVMQRLHPMDPAGAAIARGWTSLVLPMRYNSEMPPKFGGVQPEDPRTEPGELLMPTLFGAERVAELVEDLGEQALGQLDQQPKPKTKGTITRESFGYDYDIDPRIIARNAAWVSLSSDAARKGTVDSDYHTVHVWAEWNGELYCLYRWAGTVTYPQYEAKMDAVIRAWGAEVVRTAGEVLIEDAANGTTYMQARARGENLIHAKTLRPGAPYRCPNLAAFVPTRHRPGIDKSKQAAWDHFYRNVSRVHLPKSAEWDVDGLRDALVGDSSRVDDLDTVTQIIIWRTVVLPGQTSHVDLTEAEDAWFYG